VAKVIDCPRGTDQDLASLYLAGTLGEEDAAAFEEHYFSCTSCRQDIERGSELRAVFGKAPVVPAVRPARSARTWLPLAAAAAIACVGLGVWQLARRPAEEAGRPVMRGSVAEVLDVKVAAGSAGGAVLSWPRHPDAASYVVHVLGADDTSVWKAQVNEPQLAIPSGVLPAPGRARGLRVEVEAFDSMGQAVAKSRLIPLPER
jgi:Putative zinc-finger